MTREELINQCKYYKGEDLPPYDLTDFASEIWASEKACCDYFADSIAGERDFLHCFASHLTKWDPYDGVQILERYVKERYPSFFNEILSTYSL